MIIVRKRWQIILFIIAIQMFLLNLIGLFFDFPKSLEIISTLFGVIALNLILAPFLRIYEYKEDKERKKQLQKFCNELSNLKNKIEKGSQQK
ncbi:hypothetical protein ACOTVS_10015 [Aliarcobacter butzleri]